MVSDLKAISLFWPIWQVSDLLASLNFVLADMAGLRFGDNFKKIAELACYRLWKRNFLRSIIRYLCQNAVAQLAVGFLRNPCCKILTVKHLQSGVVIFTSDCTYLLNILCYFTINTC